MQKISPERIDADNIKPKRINTRENNAAATIGLSIIAAAVIIIGGIIGYNEYKEREAKQAAIRAMNAWSNTVEDISTKARIESARIQEDLRQQRLDRKLRTESGISEIREQQVLAMKAQERADQCRFWKDQHQNNPTQGTRNMVAEWC
jgi:predicted hotdog family 3-hydroxylacyl-ACP dehydratase